MLEEKKQEKYGTDVKGMTKATGPMWGVREGPQDRGAEPESWGHHTGLRAGPGVPERRCHSQDALARKRKNKTTGDEHGTCLKVGVKTGQDDRYESKGLLKCQGFLLGPHRHLGSSARDP